MDPVLRQRLEDLSAHTGMTMSALVTLAVRKMQNDMAYFGMPIGNRVTVTGSEVQGYRRRRERRDLEAAG